MKILQININYKTGSTGRIMYHLDELLQKKGFDSFVAYGRSEKEDFHTIKIGNKFDMYIHGFGTRIFDKHGLYSRRATINFINQIDKLDIDIFHLHNIHGYYLHYSTLFKYLKEKNKPVIWTLHDCWAFTGHCIHYDYIGCNRWQSECFDCSQKNRYPASFFIDNSKNNFLLKKKYFTSLEKLTIVTPSKWLANEVRKSFLKDYDIKVIHNGINLEVFKKVYSNFREKYGIENKFVILGVANVWEERKGFKDFIELSKMIGGDEIIVLIGLDHKQIKLLPKNIIGIKRTNNQQKLVEIYTEVDVFINPTLEEVLGLTNIESLACGTPVITFDSGGSSETIDENSGIVVEKGNLSKLYSAIKIVKQKSRRVYEKFCRTRVERLFDKEKNYNEYIKLYENLLKEN